MIKMSTVTTWRVEHAEFDAKTPGDRDDEGYPPLRVERRPLGIMLPPSQQTAEFHLTIGASTTVISEQTAAELMDWLQDRGVMRTSSAHLSWTSELKHLRDNGYQPMYNGRPSCPFCAQFLDDGETHSEGCPLVAALGGES